MPEGRQVQEMFARMADRYDVTNRVISAGVDRGWRRAAVRVAEVQPGERALDVCAGTGDLTLALSEAGAKVVGSDFTLPMLAKARAKALKVHDRGAGPVEFVVGDTMELPFADDSFDLATAAFGIRNVSEPVGGLREMARVVRPGGRIVVLEFCKPRVPGLSALYLFYFRRILPVLGRVVSGNKHGAYSYLPRTVMAFPEREAFLDLMRQAGMGSPRSKTLTCGIAAIYRAEAPR